MTQELGMHSIRKDMERFRRQLEVPDALTASIETATVAFIDDIERFLARRRVVPR
jgi:hypothetical protein